MKANSRFLNWFVQACIVIGMLAGVALILEIYVYEMPIVIDFFAREGKPEFFAVLSGVIATLCIIGGEYIAMTLFCMMSTLESDPFVQKNVNALRRMGMTALLIALLGLSTLLLHPVPLAVDRGDSGRHVRVVFSGAQPRVCAGGCVQTGKRPHNLAGWRYDSGQSRRHDGKAQDQPQRTGQAHGHLAGEPLDTEKQQMQGDTLFHAEQPLRNSQLRGGGYPRISERRRTQWNRIRRRITYRIRRGSAPRRPKPQLWLLGGAILIGVACELWMEKDYYFLYSVFWLVTLAVFVAFNFKRVIANKTVLALIVPTLVLCGILMFDYMNTELLGFTMLAIPALLITIGVFTTQQISYKREGKAALGALIAVFVKPFSAIGSYFRAYAGVFPAKNHSGARHGWLGVAIGLPLVTIVLALLASADAGTAKLLGGLFEQVSIWQWFWRIVVVFLVSMLFYSLFYNLTWGKADADLAPVKQNWKLAGAAVVICMLLAAYALFTYVQFTYLFGGTLPVELTYSEYAREGFGTVSRGDDDQLHRAGLKPGQERAGQGGQSAANAAHCSRA